MFHIQFYGKIQLRQHSTILDQYWLMVALLADFANVGLRLAIVCTIGGFCTTGQWWLLNHCSVCICLGFVTDGPMLGQQWTFIQDGCNRDSENFEKDYYHVACVMIRFQLSPQILKHYLTILRHKKN